MKLLASDWNLKNKWISRQAERPGRTVHKYSKQINLVYFLVQGLGQGKSWMSQAEDSILQVCQLTELQQTTEWERYPQWFQQLSETLLPENLGRHCWQWPAAQWDTPARKLGTALLTMASSSVRHSSQKTWDGTVDNGQQAKGMQRSTFFFKKQQTQDWWLSH